MENLKENNKRFEMKILWGLLYIKKSSDLKSVNRKTNSNRSEKKENGKQRKVFSVIKFFFSVLLGFGNVQNFLVEHGRKVWGVILDILHKNF